MTPLPPADPRYYVVRFQLPTFPRTVTIKHANPLARMGVTVYGMAQFTSYGYTAGFDKQSGTSQLFVLVCVDCEGRWESVQVCL